MTTNDPASLAAHVSLPGLAPVKRVVLFAATFWEMKAVRAALGRTALGREVRLSYPERRVQVSRIGGREYWLAQTGIGPQLARQVATQVLTSVPFSLAVSTGFACALVPAEVGMLLLGREVLVDEEEKGEGQDLALEVPGDERETIIRLALRGRCAARLGRFVSAGRVVGSAMEKRRIADRTGAIGLDMESAALAEEAKRAKVPFVIVRTVSDLLDEDLPLDFNLFLRPSGWLKGTALVVGRPARLVGLWRLRRQAQAAANNLTAFLKRYVATGE
ncbi:MAG: hypothetical protein NNA23_04865 [Nitrospira sp.]|nr:hypothetical protein [Nitrospira sp.]